MSEGQVFFSLIPNITMHLPGVKPVRFKNGRFPGRVRDKCTDPQIIAALKACPEYGPQIISEKDKIIRDTPDPKVEKDLIKKALKSLSEIPGVVPSELIPSSPPQEESEESPEQNSEQLVQAPSLTVPDFVPPSLTEVTRMNKDDLFTAAEMLGVEVLEGDTAAMLKRRVRSEIKRIA